MYDSQGWVRAKAGVQDWIQVSLSGVGTQVLDPSPAACQAVPWHKAKSKHSDSGTPVQDAGIQDNVLTSVSDQVPTLSYPSLFRAETDFLFFLKKKFLVHISGNLVDTK